MMNKKEGLLFSVAIFFTVVAWLVLDIYHIQSKINEQIDIKPATIPQYNMDKAVIDSLKNKK